MIYNLFLLLAPVFLGGLIVYFLERKQYQYLIKLTLAFSGGFLLSIAFIHFLPELYANHHTEIGVWVLLGFLVQLFLEYFSGGIEHGHIHTHGESKIPYTVLISLSVHSFIEGVPLLSGVGHEHGDNHSLSLIWGIVLHQLPVSIALMTLLRQSHNSWSKSWIILGLFGIMTPMGMVLGSTGLTGNLGELSDYLLALVVGMFLHISTTIIFETNEQHSFNLVKLIAILSGVGLSFLI